MNPGANELSRETYPQQDPEAVGYSRLGEVVGGVREVDIAVLAIEQTVRAAESMNQASQPVPEQQIIEPVTSVVPADFAEHRRNVENALRLQEQRRLEDSNAQKAA